MTSVFKIRRLILADFFYFEIFFPKKIFLILLNIL